MQAACCGVLIVGLSVHFSTEFVYQFYCGAALTCSDNDDIKILIFPSIFTTMNKDNTPSRQSRRIRGLGIAPQRLSMNRAAQRAPPASAEAPTTASTLTAPSPPRTRQVVERSNITLFQLSFPLLSKQETRRRRKLHMTGVALKKMSELLTRRTI